MTASRLLLLVALGCALVLSHAPAADEVEHGFVDKVYKDADGKEPKYTEYPGVEHNSWTKAYGTQELYDWLWEQKWK